MTGTVPTTGAPATQQPLLRRVAPVLAVGVGVGLATLALHLRDPHVEGSWGFCPSALLGFACPFCGSLRAVHLLTDLDLAAAASSNLLLVLGAPFAVLLWGVALARAVSGRARPVPRVPSALWWLAVAVVVVYGVLRNLPFGPGPWLAP